MSEEASLNAMRLAPRCGAKTRAGHPCRGPARRGKKRCRMHGSGGAPFGNRNSEKHGLRGRAMRDMQELARLLRSEAALL